MTAAATGPKPKVDLAEARKELDTLLPQFDGMAGTYEKMSELRARPVYISILRLDGATNQRGFEVDKMVAGLGGSSQHPAPHDHCPQVHGSH